jgi:hypothetical protein
VNSTDHVILTATFAVSGVVVIDVPVNADGSWSDDLTVPAGALTGPGLLAGLCFQNGLPSLTTTYTPATFTVTTAAPTTTTTAPPTTTTTNAPTPTRTAAAPSSTAAPPTTIAATATGSTPDEQGGTHSTLTAAHGSGGTATTTPGRDDQTESDPPTGTTHDGEPPARGPDDVDSAREARSAARYVSTLDDLALTGTGNTSGSWLDGLWGLLALPVTASVATMGFLYKRLRNRAM